MSNPFEIRPAVAGEGRLVARLIRRSIPPDLRPLTIWASPRVERYVESLLAVGRPGEGSGFYFLEQLGDPVGLAAWRELDGQAFLSHLYVLPRWRSQGLGRRLLAASLAEHLRRRPAPAVSLDVLARNTRAASWYERLGFAPRLACSWWLGPRCKPGPGRPGVPARLRAVADRQHRAWGFSSLPVAGGAAPRLSVGRLYAPYFRLPDPGAARDPALRATLGRLDPRRRLLLVAPSPQPAPGWRRAAVSLRLDCPAGALLGRLASGGRP